MVRADRIYTVFVAENLPGKPAPYLISGLSCLYGNTRETDTDTDTNRDTDIDIDYNILQAKHILVHKLGGIRWRDVWEKCPP